MTNSSVVKTIWVTIKKIDFWSYSASKENVLTSLTQRESDESTEDSKDMPKFIDCCGCKNKKSLV